MAEESEEKDVDKDVEALLKASRARARVKAWRTANPERSAAAIAKCKAAKPEKYKALQAAVRRKNKEAYGVVKTAWAKANAEKVKQYSVKWKEKNPEKRKTAANEWRKRNPEKVNVVDARRRATRLQAVPKWANHFFISEIYDLATRRTALKVGGIAEWHVDHIVPLKSNLVCGLHVEHNLQVIPGKQNLSKNNRYWPEMP